MDINQDGHMDIFIVSSRPEDSSHLYISNQGQSYTEQAADVELKI